MPRLTRIFPHAAGPLGHLAVWTGLYVTGALAAIDVFATARNPIDTFRELLALVCALLTGISVYLLDRVKLGDRFLDPADTLAHPARFTYLWARRRTLRLAICVLGAAGVIAGWLLHPLLALVVAGAHVGVLLYAGLPPKPGRRPRRVKDVLIIKNVAVGAGISVFATCLLLVARAPDLSTLDAWLAGARPLWIPALAVALIATADAVLCDLDDVPTDQRYGTQTIPGRSTTRLAWVASLTTQILAGALAILLARRAPESIALAIAIPATTAMLWVWSPPAVRDLVDLRLPIFAGLALLATHVR